ncbi:MAG: OB-fold nucleic acid binding domain-containing protein, partial [Parcubacteria group bacterium]
LGEQREKFIQGCIKTGVGKEIAEKVFAFIEPFAGYGFNRAHAVCYAMIAYQTAYLKANYPAEFMAALLRSDEDNLDRLAIEIAECAQLGIEVLPPSINQSMTHFTVVDLPKGRFAIRFGLAGIKNLGSDAVEAIRSEHKKSGSFTSLADLLSRVPAQAINKKSLESLIKSGALDEFAERQAMLSSVNSLTSLARQAEALRNSNQMSLFGKSKRVQLNLTLESTEPATRMQRLKWEKELLGLYVSEQPLVEHREIITRHAYPIGSLTLQHAGQPVTIVALVSHIQKKITRAGEPMLFVQLDDFSGTTEALVFPSLLRENPELFVEDAVLTVRGKVSDKDGTIKILANSASPFDPEALARENPVAQPAPALKSAPALQPAGDFVELLLEQAFTAERLKQLKATLEGLPSGTSVVHLRIKEGVRERRIQTAYKIARQPAVLQQLESIVGKGRVFTTVL